MHTRYRHRIGLALVTTLVLATPVRAQQRFTLEQILSAGFPSQLVAAPDGARLAWVQNAQGVRNVWIAEGPDFRGRQLTQYLQDDGQALSNLQFTPDGGSIAFVRGGAPNPSGEIPNPLSAPDAVERAIWIVATAGGEPRKLAEGSSPTISPTGGAVAFLQGGQVWAATLDDSAGVERLFTVRGNAASLRWSPDGSMLAFVSTRGDHSFVGVYQTAERRIEYLDPSVDRDGNPTWSPDGQRIAFIRIPNDRNWVLFTPRREGEPWSIRVADVGSGVSQEIWRAPPGTGSAFRRIEAPNQLFWGASDRLVFPWERDGWTHLYSVPVGGGEATLLTPGEFEVEHAMLGPDRKVMIFSSNQDDIDRRHIWRVSVSGGKQSALTTGGGIEWSPVMTANGRAIAFLASDARTPAHAEVIVGLGGSRRYLAPGTIPDEFPHRHLVEPQQVIFSGADGMRIHGQLFLPGDIRRGERRPAVLFFHGGSRRQMLLGWHYRGYYHNAYALNQYLTSRGYIVLAVNYRSGIGYGMEFREALNYGANGASEFNDVMGAGLYLQSRPDVAPDRIGLWGGSYGGYLTALGLARASDLFAAGVDVHGVHDWNIVIRNFRPSYDPTARPEAARQAFESSPMAFIKDWRSPVLVIHGDDDRNVPFSETVDLVESLRDQGVEVEQLIFPDEVHGFLLHKNWLAAYRAAAEFFERKLGRRAMTRR